MSNDDQTLYGGLQELSGTTFTSANHSGDIIDMDMLHAARESGVALPTGGNVDQSRYHGAVVFDPKPGLHRNVVYPDFSALYPRIMLDCNMSPETLVGVGDVALMQSDHDRDDLRWSYVDPRPVKQLDDGEVYSEFTNGDYKMVVDPQSSTIKWRDSWSRIQTHIEPVYFLSPEVQQGIIPSRVETYISWNKSYEGTMYSATKRVRNSLYGTTGYERFRLFDWRVAESVTLAGRLLLEWSAEEIGDRLQSQFSGEVTPVIGDTDGFGLSVDVDGGRDAVLPRVKETVEWLNDDGVSEFARDNFGVPDTCHEIDLESYARRLFVPEEGDGTGIKKTYAQNITWDEGDDVDETNIKGFEAKRSDISDITESVQTEVLQTLLTEPHDAARDEAYETVRDAVERVRDGSVPLQQIGQRGGLGKPPEEYGSENRRAHPIYRGAKWARDNIDGEDEFNKPFKFPVRSVGGDYPSTYNTDTAEDGDTVDYVSVEDPSNLPNAVTVNRDEVVEKQIRQPLETILRGMKWDWDAIMSGHEQTGLAAFGSIQ